MKIGCAYIRVSTDDQLEYSPDSQIKLIQEYAKKNDIIIPEEFIFIDAGISGLVAKIVADHIVNGTPVAEYTIGAVTE